MWRGQGVHQLQITALDPGCHRQLQFQGLPQQRDNHGVNEVVDQVVQRFGEHALMPCRMIHRSAMPTALPPSWARSEGFQCGDSSSSKH